MKQRIRNDFIFMQTIELSAESENYQIKNEEAANGYTVKMYSVINDVNGEELRSRNVEEEYLAPSSSIGAGLASKLRNSILLQVK